MIARPLLPLHKDFTLIPERCERCRWWAQWLQERILGTCGVRRDCTDKWDTCKNFEERK